MIVGLALAWLAILIASWLGWQLLRQNGRILLRLDEMEERLNELEFGDANEPEGLPLGSQAPPFELADRAGGRRSLAQFHGQPVLLVFFNPECGFCRELMPKLAGLAPHPHALPVGRGEGGRSPKEGRPLPLILTTGDAEKNRQLFTEHKVACPVLLQNDGEVAKAYQANGTPTGYLVSADGKIASELAIGAEALVKLASQPARDLPLTLTLSPSDGEREISGGNGEGRTNRFRNHSLAGSKLKRAGLKAGTPAPDFSLPRADGRGDLTLSELRGKRVLLVFSSPHCGPCNMLAPELEKFHRQQMERDRSPVAARRNQKSAVAAGFDRTGQVDAAADGDRPRSDRVAVVMISKGEPKENRAKLKEHGLTFPVVLQLHWEVSRRYAMFATPIAYLIDEAGVIASEVAVGLEPILALLSIASRQAAEKVLATG